jgi:putative spermidine/putrescine transport system permease protein
MTGEATAVERRTLKARLARAERRRRFGAFLLVAPLLAFTLFVFVTPLADMLRRSVQDDELADAWPVVAQALRGWDDEAGEGVPAEPVFAALARDMKTSWADRTTASAARRLNYDLIDGRSLVMNTARTVVAMAAEPPSWREALIAEDGRWNERATWVAIRRASGPVSDFFLLASVDLMRDVDGAIVSVPAERRLYVEVYQRTFVIAFTVTLACLILGFPAAYLLARLPPRIGNLMLILVLLPFWTPFLVRTGAWIVVLQENGFINQAIVWLGLSVGPVRLIYNRIGVIVAMTHVLLPFMILPAYSVMRTIPPQYVRAARSLGAPPTTAFFKVYLPQALPGLAAALGTGLLAATLVLYALYARLVGGARVGSI